MKTRTIILTLLISTLGLVSMASAQDVKPQVRATAGGTLDISTRISHGYLPKHSTKEIWATVKVEGGDAVSTGDRAPLNIALVVDRSTSMSGGKLEQAKVASRRLVDMLSPEDRLAIVSYGSDVSTEIESRPATSANKELFHNAIDRIRLSGSTNLSGGYERGVKLVMPHNRDETVNRVILLSDGQANVGVTQLAQLRALASRHLERGVSLSTMGIGLDYNEELMTAMAENGAGNYYFIEDEAALASIFEKECKGLSATVAKKTVLTLEVSPGVELLEVRGFPYKLEGNRAKIQLAAFFARQTKDITARLSVTTGAPGEMPVLSARLDYEDVAQSKRVNAVTAVTAVATADSKKLARVENDVMKRVEQVKIAKTFKDAMSAYEKGERKKAEKLIAEQRRETAKNARTYDFEDDASFERVDGELESMQQQMGRSRSSSKDGKRLRKAQKKRAYDIANTAELF